MYFMWYSPKFIKIIPHKSKKFLNLRIKFRNDASVNANNTAVHKFKTLLSLTLFKKQYPTVLKSVSIFEGLQFLSLRVLLKNESHIFILLKYYSKLTNKLNWGTLKQNISFATYQVNNFVVFSKPKTQLFMLIFQKKPIFIFTGGLMRIVINEKRKSNKKLYKVAISIIKLATLLTQKKQYMDEFVLKLVNLGALRYKVLKNFNTEKIKFKVKYVIIKIKFDPTAQKLSTRRSIKKYVKKRYKIQ